MNKASIIRKAANEIGDYSSNKELQKYIFNKYNVKVLSSQITNTLGTITHRRSAIPELLIRKAKEFFALCRNDFQLIYRLIRMEKNNGN